MTKPSLFNHYEAYNAEAQGIANEFYAAIKPIFDKYKDLCMVRELTLIAINEASCIGSEIILLEALDKRNREKNDS